MLTHLKTFHGYRYLLWMWTIREIKIRYKQSLLGALWGDSATVVFNAYLYRCFFLFCAHPPPMGCLILFLPTPPFYPGLFWRR